MTQGFGGFVLLLRAGCGIGCRPGGSPLFRGILLCLQTMTKIKILN